MESRIDSSDDSSTEPTEGVATMFGLREKEKSERGPRLTKKGAKSTEALINIACDKIASTTTKVAKGPHTTPPGLEMEPPYRGSKAMLRIDKVWITSGMKQELYKAHRTKEMMKHCKRRYGWTRRVYNLVDSGAIRRARRKQSRTRRV